MNQKNWINYLKCTQKRFDNFNNSIKPFKKIKLGEMKLGKVIKLQSLVNQM